MKKVILIFALIIVMSSCKKADAAVCVGCISFYFENPQPINDSELNSFPSKFKGLYTSPDSTFLRIDDNGMFREYYYKFRVHRKEMDSLKSEYNLIDGKLITKDTKDKFDILKIGDSIELSRKNTDTLFRLSYNQKLKRINGQLVLSTRDSVFWKIEMMSLEKNVLKIKSIYLLEDLKKVDSVTKIKAKELDSLSYLIKPTRSEFKKILKIKKLGYDQEYKKLSN
ncbi:hypothetical protein SAMN05444671_1254 [Flavobacterium sp. CF108]|uniref:hypothetical protein n=1 Tax=unclassified Flavobacterium TaxID=196869 RepID=UPI0008D80BD0|nr:MULTISPECIES: hypothetical protein [unclassified Flavobacterium]SEO84473.1 hypothetical protein SAMN04487978_3799 [Flavobacterium sp. fv08]SHG70880.1 hypothetical protein SAMN05444671_1254 [Flavobacterium sp. CF108]